MIWIKRLFIPIIVFFFTIIIFFSTEFILSKYVGLGQPVVYDPHLLWGYSPKPNKVYNRFKNNTVTINNIGLRSQKNWNTKEKNILFLGDSVTYGGSYISDEETFVSIACNKLTDWNCHNGGVNAYGILNIVARSNYDKRFQNDSIRVFTFITADFSRGLQKSSAAHFILRDPPNIFPAIWEATNFVVAKLNIISWFGKKKSDKVLLPEEFSDQQKMAESFALEIFLNEIDNLKKSGKDFILIHSPSKLELSNAKSLNENFIIKTLLNEFPEEFIMLSETALKNYRENYDGIFYDDQHYSKKGHQIVGKFINNILEEKIYK